MTTVVIIQEYIPEYRVPFFERLIKLGAEQGIEIRVAAGRPNREQSGRADRASLQNVVDVAQKEFRLAGKRIVLRSTSRVIRGADLVVLEQARRNLDVYRLFLPRTFRRARYALWGHGRDYVSRHSNFTKWLQNKITSRSDWFFAYTPRGAEYVAALPYPDERITVVMNSVDTTAIRAGISRVSQCDIADFRERWNLTGSIASFIGAVDDSKRLPFLLDAIRELNSQNVDASYVIAGEGLLLERLKAETDDIQNIRFIGRADAHVKNLLLAASKLLLVPGRVGLVAVDSLAAGVPIATTRWPFHAPEFEYLVADRTSIVSGDSVQAYAAKVAEALANDEYLQFLAQNSVEAGNALGVGHMANNYLAGIKGALSLRGKI